MKSSLFLMEQIIAILVFALCASICVRIFTASYIMSAEAENMNNALIIAKNAAECYKSASGSVEKAAHILEGVYSENSVFVYYDKNRQACAESKAAYILSITGVSAKAPRTASLSVKSKTGEEILAFAVAARGAQE